MALKFQIDNLKLESSLSNVGISCNYQIVNYVELYRDYLLINDKGSVESLRVSLEHLTEFKKERFNFLLYIFKCMVNEKLS